MFSLKTFFHYIEYDFNMTTKEKLENSHGTLVQELTIQGHIPNSCRSFRIELK